uniref:Fatty acyl-CoA reductase n=1 Tax=Kalanchoe fedtschenkoi TaxID=63787 RepID=A0A7N0VI45_KALFE
MDSLYLKISSSPKMLSSCCQAPYYWNKHKSNLSFTRITCSRSDSERAAHASSVSAITGGTSRVVTPDSTVSDKSLAIPAAVPEAPSGITGIGIVKFLHGKNYFITGATGFLGKVFLEKLLRSTPTTGKIYLLINAENKEAARMRLQSEIIDSELFVHLKQMYGDSYNDVMMKKLVPIVGDTSKASLGMDADCAEEIEKEVDVIVHSAANTVFDARYDVSIDVNIKGSYNLLSLAKLCKKLKVFVHVSTAYANGEREGIIIEKPLRMGDSVEAAGCDGGLSSFEALDVDAEMKLASSVAASTEKDMVTQKMKELGLQRAKLYGWRNTYEFTKAMAEMIIDRFRGDIPVVIMRPTVVESVLGEPAPGWMQGNRMVDPLIISYGKGHLHGFLTSPDAILDVIPADIVANAMLAAMAKHGQKTKPSLNVYHVASSVVNPLSVGDIFKYAHKYFIGNPICGRMRVNEMQYLSSLENFKSYMVQHELNQSAIKTAAKFNSSPEGLKAAQKKKIEHFLHLAKIYEPYSFYKGRFDSSNATKLMNEMSNEERRKFRIDVKSLDWEDYFVNVHVPGLIKYVLKK